METTTFTVPSISCSICSGKIKEGVGALNGVGNISVDLKSQSVNVEYDPSNLQPQDIKKKISSLGYEVIQ